MDYIIDFCLLSRDNCLKQVSIFRLPFNFMSICIYYIIIIKNIKNLLNPIKSMTWVGGGLIQSVIVLIFFYKTLSS